MMKPSVPKETDMNKTELLSIIENQKSEIKSLQDKVSDLEYERDAMIDNFQLTSSVLLERLKDLEQWKQEQEIS